MQSATATSLIVRQCLVATDLLGPAVTVASHIQLVSVVQKTLAVEYVGKLDISKSIALLLVVSHVHHVFVQSRQQTGMCVQSTKLPKNHRMSHHRVEYTSVVSTLTFVSNYPKYVEICSEQDCSSQITQVLDNVGISREANNLLKQLAFISTSLDKLQSDSTFLADAVEIWHDVIQ